MLNWTTITNKTVDQLLDYCYNTHMNKKLTSFEWAKVLQKNNTFICSNVVKKVDTKNHFCYTNDMLVKTAYKL